jgi:hypothetical protein
VNNFAMRCVVLPSALERPASCVANRVLGIHLPPSGLLCFAHQTTSPVKYGGGACHVAHPSPTARTKQATSPVSRARGRSLLHLALHVRPFSPSSRGGCPVRGRQQREDSTLHICPLRGCHNIASNRISRPYPGNRSNAGMPSGT